MSKGELHQIEELPDLKVAWHESCKCLNEPLLEYVREVANHFLPDYEEADTGMIPVESSAPAIFANRYAERNLSVEERYERTQEMRTFKGTLEEYKKREYRKLDDSFKEKFLNNKNLQHTIEAFDFDVSKFWYLLLFVYDFIEDIGTDAPIVEKPLLEDFASFLTNLCGASSITLKQGDKNIYYTEREDLIDIIQRAVYHFGETYSKIVNGGQDPKTKIKQLQELGLKGFIDNSLLSQINFNGKYTLDYSHKRWKFAEMFLYFLEGKKADKKRISDRNVRISTEKNLFVSRLLYTTGYVSEVYGREFFPNGKPNRALSLIIRKYSKEKFPPVIANNYNVVAL